MRRAIIVVLVASGVVTGSIGQAAAAGTSIELCKIEASQAERTMQYRQGGGDMMKLIESAKSDQVPPLFIAALKVPVYTASDEQKQAVERFRDETLAHCLAAD